MVEARSVNVKNTHTHMQRMCKNIDAVQVFKMYELPRLSQETTCLDSSLILQMREKRLKVKFKACAHVALRGIPLSLLKIRLYNASKGFPNDTGGNGTHTQ